MFLNGLNFFKIVIFLFLIIVGINFIIQGILVLKNNSLKNESIINLSKINKYKQSASKIKAINNGNIKSKNEDYLLEQNKDLKENLREIIIIVKKNDTFSKIINPFFENNNIKNSIINEINKKYNLKNLNIGKKIYFYKNENNDIVKIILPKSFGIDLILQIKNKDISIREEKIEIQKEINSLEFIVSSSIYEDGIKAGVPLSILINAIHLYSFDIDFQRDIKKNTKFEISYETLYNFKRKDIDYNNIQYINLKIQNTDLEYFLFKTNDGFNEYFNREGKNVKKSLLKTPIDGAQLSSNFGMRKHPILGYNKLHKGVDFAAPNGTPIYAGGNGVIDYLGNNGGYGKYIRIRHNNEYKTAYAHLSSFKKNIFKGKRVNQGDIIGYVGTTGKSTGPHLHYEILYQNKQINPMKMKLPSGKILKGSELKRFKKSVNDIYSNYLFNLYE